MSLGFSERSGLSCNNDGNDAGAAGEPKRPPMIECSSSTMSVELSASRPMAKRQPSVSSSTAPTARAIGSSNPAGSCAFKTRTSSNG
jgi:hypothetical protein